MIMAEYELRVDGKAIRYSADLCSSFLDAWAEECAKYPNAEKQVEIVRVKEDVIFSQYHFHRLKRLYESHSVQLSNASNAKPVQASTPPDMKVNEDFKSYLQCIAHRYGLPLPVYRTEMEPGGAGMFRATVKFEWDGETLTTPPMTGRGKKTAEKLAAQHMVQVILPARGFVSIEQDDGSEGGDHD